jgi:hypothetical protein
MRQLKENPKERMWGRKYYKKDWCNLQRKQILLTYKTILINQ